MNPELFLLSMLDAFGGKTAGRTLLQKRAFFVELLSTRESKLQFDAHYYGPFSSSLESSVSKLKTLGLISENNTGFGFAIKGFEVKRYDYSLTDEGKVVVDSIRGTAEYQSIAEAAKRLRDAGDPDYIELSIAAKAYFILQKKQMPMSRQQILEEASTFDWNIDKAALENSVRFLEQIQLVKLPKAMA
jgi:uncharacterized protein YwgA